MISKQLDTNSYVSYVKEFGDEECAKAIKEAYESTLLYCDKCEAGLPSGRSSTTQTPTTQTLTKNN